MPHSLVFYPDYRRANPYQTLLYQHAGGEFHPTPGSIETALAGLAQQGPGERLIFHLHWEDAAFRAELDEAAAWAAAQAFLARLEQFVGAGGAFLWTLHNAAPHDGRHLAVHAELGRRLAGLADIVHVHSHTAAAWALRLGAERARIAIVPHGNYLPLHQPLARPQATSRRMLGLPEDARLLLLFGRLGSYKGAAQLLDAFRETAAETPALHLAVAGKQIEPLDRALASLPGDVRSRILVEDRFLPPEEVAALFHAADMVALPYRAILTSGTALLALSLRRPLLAPAHPALRELLRDGEDALLYDPAAPTGLASGLRRLAALDQAELERMQGTAGETAARHDWRQSGLLLRGLLYQLLHLPRPRRLVGAEPAPAQPALGGCS